VTDIPFTAPTPEVYILLATYNGEAFVEEQVASIQNQNYTNWRILARDDGSVDRTREILLRLAKCDARIQMIEDDPQRNLGPRGSFGLLMQRALASGARYACFCDQDDVWHPEKITRELSVATELERRSGKKHPVLVYTDLEVVDRDLQLISRSFYEFQGIRRGRDEPPFSTLLVQNHVVGCTAMMNRALLGIASPIPDTAYMHDWWTALCAGACGSLVFIRQATVRYRQHQANQVGVGGIKRLKQISALGTVFHKMNRIFLYSIAQANPLALRLAEMARGSSLDCAKASQVLADVETWSHLRETKLLRRIGAALRRNMRSQNLPLTLVLYLQLVILPLLTKHSASDDVL
jgi:glycosyltransferase involved in cell wall biosynthesis